MILYQNGLVKNTSTDYLVLESGNVGELIFSPNPKEFEVDKEEKIFIYEYSTDTVHKKFGFKNFKERMLFRNLITIPGIGPTISFSILKKGYENIIQMIANKDTKGLSKLNYVSDKIANQIIIKLNNRYKTSATEVMDNPEQGKLINNDIDNIVGTLKSLGFKKQQIDTALENVDLSSGLENIVEESIKYIATATRQSSKA